MTYELLALVTVACAGTAAAAAHRDLVGPFSIDPDLDCAMRSLAYNYSLHLLPDRAPLMSVFDALRLAIDCNATLPPPVPKASSANEAPLSLSFAVTYYADAITGSDANPGTLNAPFATVARALEASRSGPRPPQILLRAGTFYLPSTLVLTPVDSGLSVAAFPGEAPVLSGGALLTDLSWGPFTPPGPPAPNITGPTPGSLLAWQGGGCVDGPGKSNPGVCAPLGQFPAVEPCVAACLDSAACTGYTYHTADAGAEWATWCYARLDGDNDIVGADSGHLSGYKTHGGGVTSTWRAAINATAAFNQLYVGGRRAVRARWPNANPETQQSPVGFATAAKWLPPRSYAAPTEVNTPGVRPSDPFFPDFQWGTGGTVANFTTGSFWGTNSPPAGGTFRVPSGLTASQDLLPRIANWTQASDAIVHAFHDGYWGDWAFSVGSADAATGDVVFSAGGTQEARGSAGGGGFYVENVLSELDAAGEWFFDEGAATLYLCVNGSAPPPAGLELVASQLDSLVQLQGSQAAPVVGVSLSGLTLSHTAATFMSPFTAPSGGDWSAHVGGAVIFNGTVACELTGSTIASVGGTGLAIAGYNRGALVSGNEFVWLGESAIISVGLRGDALDGNLGGDFPAGTLIAGNLAHEIGVFVKQTGFYYAGVSANATLVNNVFFNGPRAGINVNDGFAGGHLIQNNLGFNFVRETSDHGVYNSWDREPYQWNPLNTSVVDPLPIVLNQNLFINNYRSSWPIDNDDGSNGYVESNNFLLWGGSKQYLGFNKHMISNVYVYADYSPAQSPAVAAMRAPAGLASSYPRPGLRNGWGVCAMAYGTHAFQAPLVDVWRNNTCITQSSSKFFDFNGCNTGAPTDGNIPALSGNAYLSDDGGYSLKCDKTEWTLAQAQAAGVDIGSAAGPAPSLAALIQLGHAQLGF